MDELPISILKKYWHYNTFRHPQEEIIQAVIQHQDVLALMPTGGGKSLCYQVPAMIQEGLCLVITPLVALMKDQVDQLISKNIQAASLHTGMTFMEIKQVLNNVIHGKYQFLYVSPERLSSKLFLEFLPDLDIQLIAVDEAHCISQWGYDFRPSYLQIGALRKYLPGINLIALTASATMQVTEDIVEKLNLENPAIFRASFERPNLSYSVFQTESKMNKLLDILSHVPGSSIVYCKTRKTAQQVAGLLKENHISATYYHAGLSPENRDEKQLAWKSGALRVMCSTNAFGMGIDKQNVRTVIHFDVPDALESFYQEAGRAGRDGKRAYAVVLHNLKDLEGISQLADLKYPSIPVIKKIYQSISDYLSIPVQSGGGEYFSFQVNEFCRVFKYGVMETINVLKALEQEGHLTFNASIFLPSHAGFLASKQWLNDFEKLYPHLEPLIKTLLRTYDGIFDTKVPINEQQIARILKSDETKIRHGLEVLQTQGIIDYSPAKNTPQIYFNWDRASAAHLHIHTKRYAALKKNYQKRIEVMRAFLILKDTCRSRFIASYFGDKTLSNCGICDICLDKKNPKLTNKEFTEIQEKIYAFIPEKGIPLKHLIDPLSDMMQKKYWIVIDFLRGEGLLTIDDAGIMYHKKSKV
ncbi:MAG: RecQ family ATP-dependent DNA helicase [Bacteroidetes bacterium]|nr:RecQ family ATP-dependent DNA helicase [Bacteroidota bacterium]